MGRREFWRHSWATRRRARICVSMQHHNPSTTGYATRAPRRANENDPSASDTESGHWRTVRQLATEALRSRTKDIEIAAWLTESLARHDGLTGLAEGAAILTGLIGQFWDMGLYPTADPAEPEERLLSIS